jgi:hypothetical protein
MGKVGNDGGRDNAMIHKTQGQHITIDTTTTTNDEMQQRADAEGRVAGF